MRHKIIYAIKAYVDDDAKAVQQFTDRLLLVGIQTSLIKSTEKYSYYESSWDDADVLEVPLKEHNARNAGAKPKELFYQDEPVSCGFIYLLRTQKHLSDAEIAFLFDVSESTISRRRKKHMESGDFCENSEVVF